MKSHANLESQALESQAQGPQGGPAQQALIPFTLSLGPDSPTVRRTCPKPSTLFQAEELTWLLDLCFEWKVRLLFWVL